MPRKDLAYLKSAIPAKFLPLRVGVVVLYVLSTLFSEFRYYFMVYTTGTVSEASVWEEEKGIGPSTFYP